MTLIEVTVAIFLVAVLGTTAASITWSTIQTQEDALVLHERYHMGRVAMTRLKRELSMAFVSLHQADDARTQTVFDGEDDRLLFATKAHEPVRRDAHQSDQLELEYFVNKDQQLMRRVKFHIDDRPGKGGRVDIVAEGVRSLEFEYYDELNEDWRDDWKVEIDDAAEMRERLKLLQEERDKAEEVRSDDASGLAGVVAADAADEVIDDVASELSDGLLLPSRVKIRLTLLDNREKELVTETQVEIPMVEPLWY
ncbi:MAG: general secretion pathway protein J [Myxococcota bacterium]|jgi:general secretion pathway protein J